MGKHFKKQITDELDWIARLEARARVAADLGLHEIRAEAVADIQRRVALVRRLAD